MQLIPETSQRKFIKQAKTEHNFDLVIAADYEAFTVDVKNKKHESFMLCYQILETDDIYQVEHFKHLINNIAAIPTTKEEVNVLVYFHNLSYDC